MTDAPTATPLQVLEQRLENLENLVEMLDRSLTILEGKVDSINEWLRTKDGD